MASLVKSGKYDSMNTIDTLTMGYYVINFVSDAYTLQYYTTCKTQIISSGELVVKAQYLSCMQENTNWFWEQKNQQQVIIVSTRNILHSCIDVVAVKDDNDIPRCICNRNQAKQALQRHNICLNEYYHDSILE